jgi:aminopeptidase N
VSHKPVDEIMDSLVAQPGVPILSFSEVANGRVPVHQSRFFLDPRSQPDPAQQWSLPVCFKGGNNGEDCQVLTPTASSLEVPASPWFYANAEGKGYYRSAYAPGNYADLVAHIETELTPAERISLTGDEWALVRANRTTVGDYLDLVTALKDDMGADVVPNALANVTGIYQRLAASPEERAQLSAWIDRTFSPLLDKLGPASPSDDDNKRSLRASLLVTLGTYGKSPQVLSAARQSADAYLADPYLADRGSVDATLGQAALAVAARNGDAALFDRLQKIYETSDDPEFKDTALRFLGQFRSPDLVKRALDYAMSAKVRNQDAPFQFAAPLASNETRDVAWNYMKANWDKVQAQLTTSLGGTFVSYTGYFCSADAREDVKTFLTEHPVPASDVSLRHALEHIDGCIEFRSQQEPNLKRWLDAHSGS